MQADCRPNRVSSVSPARYMSGVPPKPARELDEWSRWARAVRHSTRHSQTEFGAQIGRARGSIADWERGVNKPDRESIELILRKFPGVPPPPLHPGGGVSDAARIVPRVAQEEGAYVVKTDQGRIVAKMIDGIEDEEARTDAMLACAAELKRHPSRLDADERPDRAQRSK